MSILTQKLNFRLFRSTFFSFQVKKWSQFWFWGPNSGFSGQIYQFTCKKLIALIISPTWSCLRNRIEIKTRTIIRQIYVSPPACLTLKAIQCILWISNTVLPFKWALDNRKAYCRQLFNISIINRDCTISWGCFFLHSYHLPVSLTGWPGNRPITRAIFFFFIVKKILFFVKILVFRSEFCY